MHIAPGVHYTPPLGLCTRGLTPSTYSTTQHAPHMHIFPFYSLKSPKRWQAMARSRDHHCVSATIGLEGFSTTRYVLYAKNCTSHWIVPPLRGWPESTVWGCVCLLTLILPAEADLTVVSGTLHGRWGSESIKGKKKKRNRKMGNTLQLKTLCDPK